MSASSIIVFRREGLLTLDTVASSAGMHPELVRCFVDFGLITAIERRGEDLFFEPEVLARLRMIRRLRESLGINLAGIAVILDLRDRISELQRANQDLRRK
jgi:DNA-binding transcriptional MerR regulator